MPSPLPDRFRLRRFIEDNRGVAATEFALIVSTLLLMLLGLCDIVPSWMAHTHTNTAAATAADTTGRFVQMQAADMVNVYSAAGNVMSPFSTATQSVRITNVFSTGVGTAKVYWSCGNGTLPPYTALTPVTSTPNGVDQTGFLFLNNVFVGVWLNGTNTSYVVVETQYKYKAPAQFVLRTPLTLNAVSYYLPRSASYVGFPWNGNVNTPPPVPTTTTHASSLTLSNGAACSYAN